MNWAQQTISKRPLSGVQGINRSCSRSILVSINAEYNLFSLCSQKASAWIFEVGGRKRPNIDTHLLLGNKKKSLLLSQGNENFKLQ